MRFSLPSLFAWIALTVLLTLVTPWASAETTTATYRLTITNNWTRDNHPAGYPDQAHFSWFGGGTHAGPESFWGLGEMATPGFEVLAESGNTPLWVQEIEAAGGSGLEWQHWFCPPEQTHTNCGSLTETFQVLSDQSFLSLASMLGPSPDWFVGIHDLDLRPTGDWLASQTLPLYLYDAGTESGVTPTIENLSNSEPMQLIAYDSAQGTYLPSAVPYQVGSLTLELLGTTTSEVSRPDLISATPSGLGGNGTSWDPSVSADGLTVAFSSDATNLTSSDSNGTVRDIFVLNRQTGELQNLTSGANGPSEDPVLSKDGRWLAFVSRATNLPTDVQDTNGVVDDVVLVELATGQMTLATLGGNAPSSSPSLSYDGRRLVFDTFATNLAGNNNQPFGCSATPANGQLRCYRHVILYDRVSTTRLNLTQGALSDSHLPRISEQGNHVAFVSRSFQLFSSGGGAQENPGVIVMNLDTGNRVYSRIELNRRPIISASGRWVAASAGSIVLRDMSIEGNPLTIAPDSDIPGEFSSDEHRIIYSSVTASRLLPDLNQGERDIYSLDLSALPNIVETRLTVGGNAPSGGPVTNADGSLIVFDSTASNFSQDNNGSLFDVFLLDSNVPSDTAPVANPQELSVGAGGSLAITLTGSAVNNEGLLFELVSEPTQGTLQGTPPNLVYTTVAGFSGRDGFEFRVTANGQTSAATLIGIEITPPVVQGFSFVATQRSDSRVIDLMASFPETAVWTQVRDFDGTTGILWDGQARTWTSSYTPTAGAQTVTFNSRYWLPGITVAHESLDVTVTLSETGGAPEPPPPTPTQDALNGYAWIDANADGLRGTDEVADTGRLVTLFRCEAPWGIAATANTDALSGQFGFAGVSPGKYQIGTAVPALGFTGIGGDNLVFANGFSNCFDFSGASLVLEIGVVGAAAPTPGPVGNVIAGFAWIDANRDGVRDAGELPDPNRRVELFRCGPPWGTAGSTTTDAAGGFVIDDLEVGEYQLGTPVPAAGFSPLGANNTVHASGFANCVSAGDGLALGIGVLP